MKAMRLRAPDAPSRECRWDWGRVNAPSSDRKPLNNIQVPIAANGSEGYALATPARSTVTSTLSSGSHNRRSGISNVDQRPTIDQLKDFIRSIGARLEDREQRARRLFVEERAASLHNDRNREFSIRSSISSYFGINYSSVSFTGSGQLGFSIHKDRLFEPGTSDLDVACIDVRLFERAWTDVVRTTKSFSDLTPFNHRNNEKIRQFQDQITRRGMILVDAMPKSSLSQSWRDYQQSLSLDHVLLFKRISVAIYINEYAFCWKQDSSLSTLLGVTS